MNHATTLKANDHKLFHSLMTSHNTMNHAPTLKASSSLVKFKSVPVSGFFLNHDNVVGDPVYGARSPHRGFCHVRVSLVGSWWVGVFVDKNG
jgi:hypothetical protein